MAKRWRCYRCNDGRFGNGLEFEAAEPACPSCKAGPPLVVPLVDIHWLAAGGGPIPTADGPHRIPCQPGRTNSHGLHLTAQPDAVTCPACKAAAKDEFARALAIHREENGL